MRFIIICYLIIYLLTGCTSEKQNRIQEPKPNIVLIVSDDHGRDDAGFLGNHVIKTPNLDKLAAEGTFFSNAYCTSASCAASRSVILTGIQNHANGMYGHSHHFHHFSSFNSVKSLPVLLQQFGYSTARAGKYHVAPDDVYDFQEKIEGDLRSAVELANSCSQFIQANRQTPFFLYFCTGDPHRSGIDTSLAFKPDLFGNRPEGYPGVNPVQYHPDSVIVPEYLPDNKATRAELAQYYQSVSRLDQGIGALINHLETAGVLDNTIVIYISDNGIAFPGAKTNQYDPAIHLPCIIRNPFSEQKGNTIDAMITWADLTPTILDFAGLLESSREILKSDQFTKRSSEEWNPTFDDFHGRSFTEVFNNEYDTSKWNEIFTSHTFHEITMYYPMRVYQNREYKLIWNIASGLEYPNASDLFESATWQSVISDPEADYAGRSIRDYNFRPEFELYNMQTDAKELNNLAYIPLYSDILAELKQKLKQYQVTTNDPWIVKWEHE